MMGRNLPDRLDHPKDYGVPGIGGIWRVLNRPESPGTPVSLGRLWTKEDVPCGVAWMAIDYRLFMAMREKND